MNISAASSRSRWLHFTPRSSMHDCARYGIHVFVAIVLTRLPLAIHVLPAAREALASHQIDDTTSIIAESDH